MEKSAHARQSLVEYLDRFRRLGEAPAYAYARGYRTARWSYGEVARVAAQFARELEARQVVPGDRVLLWGANSAEWVAAFFGCMLRGAVAVPMDRIAAPDFARRVAAQVEAKLAVCSGDLVAAAQPLPTLVLETLRDQLAHHSSVPYPAPALTRSDPLEIVFTSGTTADPKGVVIPHGNVLANLVPLETEIARYRRYERPFHPIRFLNLLPLSHVFGQFLGMFIPQLLGGTVYFQEGLGPGEIAHTVQRERISVVVTVPRVLAALKEKVERDAELAGRADVFRRDLARSANEKFLRRWWRFRRQHRQFGWKFWAFICGGAALDAETEEFWRRLGYVVIQGYGMTETTSLISVQHPFKMGRRSIGQVLPGREMKLDPATGEILVRGESVASGYWQGKELKPVIGEEGWLRTGDLGEMDAAGNLYFKGRKKSVIVSPAGLNIYPEDLEAALKQQRGVRDAVVVPLARGGNAEPGAVLLLRDGADPAAAVRGANQQLADFQHIRRWLVWPEDDFPRTATQKPRTNLIEQYAAQQLSGEAATAAAAPAGSLAEIIARITGRSVPLAPLMKLEELGLSSLDRVALMAALEDRYQVEFDEAQFAAATTVGEVDHLLRGESDAAGAAPPPQPADATAVDAAFPAAATRHVYPRWAQRWPVTWIRAAAYWLLSWPYMMLMARPRVLGSERLRDLRGPLLIVSNHITQIDIGYIMAALPPRYRSRLAVAMGGEMLRAMRHPPRSLSLFRRAWEVLDYYLVIAFFNVFPLPQRSGFRQSFAYAGESADRGYSIVVFPEGVRTRTGAISPFRSGIGLLAQRLGLPVVPVRISGLWELKQAGRHFAPPGTVRVTLGEPVRYPATTPPEEIATDLDAPRARALAAAEKLGDSRFRRGPASAGPSFDDPERINLSRGACRVGGAQRTRAARASAPPAPATRRGHALPAWSCRSASAR